MKLIKRILKIFFIVVGALLALVLVIMALVVIPQDREVDRSALVDEMYGRVDSLDVPTEGTRGFSVGFAKENITPDYLTSTAGYGNRLGKKVTSVHDSIYVRCLVVDNGTSKVAIVTADLLLIPPEVALLLEHDLSSIGFSPDNTYFGATHSHNSVGNWSHGAMTIMYGDYDNELVHYLRDKILVAIKKANASRVNASISAGQIPVTGAVRNRISRNNPVDSLLRVIRIERTDSSKLILLSFTAHATCLSDDNIVLSGDYPGLLTQSLEQQGYQFAMFMAGAVGSHAGVTREREWSCVEEMSSKLVTALNQGGSLLQTVSDTTLWMGRVRLALPEAQFKITRSLRLRPSAFNGLMGDYPEYITGLRIGNQLLMGTPCDFSGEFYPSLDSLAATQELKVMVTSFNGGYIGYVTPEKYYDVNHYETQLMNWYGPGTGEYLMSCLRMLINHAGSDSNKLEGIIKKR